MVGFSVYALATTQAPPGRDSYDERFRDATARRRGIVGGRKRSVASATMTSRSQRRAGSVCARSCHSQWVLATRNTDEALSQNLLVPNALALFIGERRHENDIELARCQF